MSINPPEQSHPKYRIRWEPYCSCTLVILAIPALFGCFFLVCVGGIQNDVLRWIKSFEFPALQARYQPMADQLATITSDPLIYESQTIENVKFMTNDEYTGNIAGDFTKVFGTNRAMKDVLDDYVQYLSSKPEWKVTTEPFTGELEDYTIAYNASHTAEIIINVRSKLEEPQFAWAKYQTVYEIIFSYGDPTLWIGG